MKFVFFGTPEFARIVLEKLLDKGFVPVALVCNPDRPVGRKKIITAPATKKLILERGLKDVLILQPEKPKDIEKELKDIGPDVFIVAAYARIIPQSILNIAKKGVIGVHPSLLPKHRGSSPIQTAILDGDEETGVCLYVLDDKMDHGPIIASESTLINGKNYIQLERTLAEIGGRLAGDNLEAYISDAIQPKEQDHSLATFTKKFETQDGFIPSDELSKALNGDNEIGQKVNNKIRALNPEPGSWTTVKNKRIKILESELKNRLILKVIQIEGEKPKKVNLINLSF